jgi:peptidoglycan/xylan/chitin deacetylase (PgdA/CDA1 family)
MTFDCCQTEKPAGYDEAIVHLLVARQVPATFFLGGRWMEAHPAATQYLASVPFFELGNHSYLHPHMTKLTAAQMADELARPQEIMQGLCGRKARFFRPPFGEWNSTLVEEADKAGMRTVTWDISTGDPDRHATVGDLMGEFRKVRPGSVVLMHANGRGWKTAEALPQMLAYLEKRGLRPATLGELLESGDPVVIHPDSG